MWCRNKYCLALLLALCVGCRHIVGGKAARGTETFKSLQRAVVAASAAVESSVVLVVPVVSEPEEGEPQSSSGLRQKIVRGSNAVIGILVTAHGHILMPGVYKPDDLSRLTVWVGDTEYQGGVIKADDQLNMTIVKITESEALVPLARDRLVDLESGSWCVSVRQSGEDLDFKRFKSLGYCSGVVDGRYRSYFVDQAFKSDNGAPVVALDGSLAGIVAAGKVLSIVDLNEDLQDFIDAATGVISPEDETKNKGWLGVMLQAINKEYAKAHDLQRSGIWVSHAVSTGPAAKAGIRTGDLIIALNGAPLRLSGLRAQNYFLQSLRPRVGSEFEITVVRDGREIVCAGSFEKIPEDDKLRARDLGVEVKAITEIDSFALNLFATNGVLVTDVEPGSAAATSSTFRSGLLRNGDVILELDGQPTPDLDEFKLVLDGVRRRKTDVLLVYFQRGRYNGYAGLNLKIGDNENGGAH